MYAALSKLGYVCKKGHFKTLKPDPIWNMNTQNAMQAYMQHVVCF